MYNKLWIKFKAYSDEDNARNKDTGKSATGFIITIGGVPFSWCSKLQHTIKRI